MCKNAPCEDVHTKCWRCMHGGACVHLHTVHHCVKMYKVLEMHGWRRICKDVLCEDVQRSGDVCIAVHVYRCTV